MKELGESEVGGGRGDRDVNFMGIFKFFLAPRKEKV